MVLKVVNWVHNDKIESYGLERGQLSTQCKYQVIWSWKSQLSTQYKKYRGCLLRASSLSFHWEIPGFQCLMLSCWRLSWKCGFCSFWFLSLPENVFRPKSVVFIKICSFHKDPWISVKICGFVKIRSFHQNPRFLSKSVVFHQNPRFLAFLSELSRGQHQIGILCETKDHLPRKVTPIFEVVSHCNDYQVERNMTSTAHYPRYTCAS